MYVKIKGMRYSVVNLSEDLHLSNFIKIHLDSETIQHYGIGYPSEESLLELFRAYVKNTEASISFHFGIVDNKTGAYIGEIGLFRINTLNKRANSYCILDKAYWKKGVLYEVSKIFYPFIFSKLDLNRIQAEVSSDNIAAVKSHISMGYKKEGVLRMHEFDEYKGMYIDIVVFSLLKGDLI